MFLNSIKMRSIAILTVVLSVTLISAALFTPVDRAGAAPAAPSAGQFLYVGNDNTPGTVRQYSLPITAASVPNFSIASNNVLTVAVDPSGNLGVGDNAGHLQFFTTPLSAASTPAASFLNGAGSNDGQNVFTTAGDMFVSTVSNRVNGFTHPFSNASIPSSFITNAALVSAIGTTLDSAQNLYISNSGVGTAVTCSSGAGSCSNLLVYAPPYSGAPIITQNLAQRSYRKVAENSNHLFVCSVGGPGPGLVDVYNLPLTPVSSGFTISNGTNLPEGIAFDAAGNLYVGNLGDSTVKVYAPPFSSTSTPTVTLSMGAGFSIFSIAIGPTPTPPQFYGDVAPRPDGDGSLTAPDVIIERQFVVGLQTPSANEFMRADCAPRATHGDGLLTAGDTIQVRRYIAGLDSIDQLPGTIEARPLNDQSDKAGMKLKSVWTQRVISVVQAEQAPQGKVVLYVQMDRQGDEAAAAFTLGFDPARLSNPVISLGSDASSGTILTTNITKSDSGQLAVLVDADEALTSGQIVSVTFDVTVNAAGETTPVTFTDAITQGSTSDAEGNLLPTRFVDGVIALPEAASPAFEISGRVLTPDGRGLRNAVVVLTDSNGVERYVTTSSFGYYQFDSLTNGVTYVIGIKSKRYSFEPRVVQALDNVTDVDFQAR